MLNEDHLHSKEHTRKSHQSPVAIRAHEIIFRSPIQSLHQSLPRLQYHPQPAEIAEFVTIDRLPYIGQLQQMMVGQMQKPPSPLFAQNDQNRTPQLNGQQHVFEIILSPPAAAVMSLPNIITNSSANMQQVVATAKHQPQQTHELTQTPQPTPPTSMPPVVQDTDPSSASSTVTTPATSTVSIHCPTCGLQLKHRKNLKSHMATHTGDKQHHCPDCPKSFLRSNQLKSHSKVHSGERPFECDVCNRTFAQSSNFRVHQRLHQSRTPFNCRHCCKRYATQAELDEHYAYHVAPDQFRCVDCGKTYTHVASLRYHRLTHTGERPFACRACGKRFVHSSVLAVHMRTHTGAKPYTCAQCGKRFAQWTNYNRHRKQMHAAGTAGGGAATSRQHQQLHSCPDCDRVFPHQRAMRAHQRVHRRPADSEQQPQVCSVCDRTFKTLKGLELHRLVHDGHCATCEITLADERAYRKHMRQHAKHSCDICGDAFRSKRQIREHMDDEHTAQPVYGCAVCGVELPDPQLDEHVRTEHVVGYEWHGCPFCEREFAHPGVLLVHLREHQGMMQNEMQCSECGIMFRRFSYYKKHKCFRAKQKRIQPTTVDGIEAMRPGYRPLGLQLNIKPNSESDFFKREQSADKVELESIAGNEVVESVTFSADLGERIDEIDIAVDTDVEHNEHDAISSAKTSDEETTESTPNLRSSPPAVPQACPVCAKVFRSVKAVRMHMPTHGPKRFQCEFCAKRFVRLSQLETHRKTHTGDRPFQCEVCARRFAQACMVTVHMRTHTGAKPFQCAHCSKRFAQAANLKRHEETHTDVRPWECRACGKRFQRKFTLQMHEKRHGQVAAADAPVAGEATAGDHTGNNETNGHDAIERVSTKQRQRAPTNRRAKPTATSKKSQLLGDFGLELPPGVPADGFIGDKPFPCMVCRKTFAQAAILQVHMRVHTGEKPYQCLKCLKSFRQWTHLNRHQSVHTGEKTFGCSQCDKYFARLQTLQIHERTHKRVHTVASIVLDGGGTDLLQLSANSILEEEQSDEIDTVIVGAGDVSIMYNIVNG